MLVIGESANIKAIVGFCRHSATWREREGIQTRYLKRWVKNITI